MTLGWRRFFVLWVSGMLGATALVPYELAVITPPRGVPLGVVVISSLLNSAILLAIAAGAGGWLARRARLGTPVIDAVLSGQRVALSRRTVLLAIGLGVVTSLLVSATDTWLYVAGYPMPESRVGLTPTPPLWAGTLASFYGGISEEIIARYCVLSLFAWLFWPIVRKSVAYAIAIVAAAVVFGAGHLPAAAQVYVMTPTTVALIVGLNAVPGIAFGWLYCRHGLEAAMGSHFAADLVLHLGIPAIVA